MTDEKPVAWMDKNGVPSTVRTELYNTPLYTKPQQWYMVNKDGYVKPLSDEEIIEQFNGSDLMQDWGSQVPIYQDVIDFVRAIEERHGIK